MAKGKNLNPADAFRKAQRKKELKKNKAERAKARDFALVKKDTHELEDEIEKFEAVVEPSSADKTRLVELKSELEKINKKKEEYVAEHPEHRKLVFKQRRHQDEQKEDTDLQQKTRALFNKHGLPRHPERSIYYDPILNPYGVPPPGMPYIERPLRPDEVASDDEGNADDDDDIIMPEGPPPSAEDRIEEEGSDDDIPMPEGPPPPRDGNPQDPAHIIPLSATRPQLPSEPHLPMPNPPLPASYPPSAHFASTIPPPPALPQTSHLTPPPPPSGFPSMPPPTPNSSLLPPPGLLQMPPPAPPFMLSAGFPPMPTPPLGFFPRRAQSSSSVQDPLSSIPHQTYQAHRAAKQAPPFPGQSRPLSGGVTLSTASVATPVSAATVEAAPQLRDFKKEATAFVPTALKRKKAGANPPSKINAAPSLTEKAGSPEVETPAPARPDLMSTLKQSLGSAISSPAANSTAAISKAPAVKPKDDYDKFLAEMGDILGPRP